MEAAPEDTGVAEINAAAASTTGVEPDDGLYAKRPSQMSAEERKQYDADVAVLKQKMRDEGSSFLTTRDANDFSSESGRFRLSVIMPIVADESTPVHRLPAEVPDKHRYRLER